MRLTLLQPSHNRIGKLVFEDAVAEAKQFINVSHCFQGQDQALDITMKIRNDPNFH